MRVNPNSLLAVLVGFTLNLGLSGAAQAAPSTSVDYQLLANGTNGSGNVHLINPQGTVSDSLTYDSPYYGPNAAHASMAAFADYGKLKIETSSDGGQVYGRSDVGTRFSDSLLINAPGQAGKTGLASIHIDYDWQLTALANMGAAFSQAQAGLGFNGSSIAVIQTLYVNCTPGPACATQDNGPQLSVFVPGQPNATFSISDSGAWAYLPFNFGQSFDILMTFSAHTQAEGMLGPRAQASVDGFHSVYWGGISSILDDQGNEVNFELSSGSGTDYRYSLAAVPEAETYVMMLAGLGLVGFMAKRRKQQVEA